MLNRATAILQMKIVGIDLSTVQTMTVTMRNMNLTIMKGNSDIEADNDIILISLTQEEARRLNEGQFNITVSATNTNGKDVSDRLKVIWVKRGNISQFSGSSGGSSGDLSGYYTKPEVDALIGSIPKGQDGFSPVATVKKDNGVSVISIQDKKGITTAQVLDGKDGRNGEDGADGMTPHIGSNGNWYVGLSDTGKPSRGEQGEKGESGGIISESEIRSMIDDSFEENINGIKMAQNEEGKWGYIPPGADTVIPFSIGEGISRDDIFIDSEYDAPSNVFSTMTQTGVYNGKVMEENPLWFEMTIVDGRIFSTEFEKINVEIEEGQNVL